MPYRGPTREIRLTGAYDANDPRLRFDPDVPIIQRMPSLAAGEGAGMRWVTGDLQDGLQKERSVSGPRLFAVVAATYLALAQFVIWLSDPVYLGAGFWPAAGLTTAALLLVPRRSWSWILAAIVVAELGGNLAHGYPLAASLWWTAGNCLGPLVGAGLVRRFGNPRRALAPLRSLVTFLVFAVVAGPLVGASIGTIGSVLSVGNPLWQVWPKYVVGDALGVLVVAPVLLTRWESHPRRSPVETTVLTVALVVVTLGVFRNWSGALDMTLPYLVTPFVTWAALRYGVRGAAWAMLWVTQVANWATVTGYGPFAYAGGATGHAVTVLQVYLAIAATSALILAALVSDLRDRAEVEQELWRQAHHDQLTGLPNRAFLNERLDRWQDGRAGDARLALLVCDLDHFKSINDGLGHHAGDQVLVEVARRLRSVVRDEDIVARLSGDEFVVLVEHDGDAPHPLDMLAGRLLAAIAEPIRLDHGGAVQTDVSVGIATTTREEGVETLLRMADAALYRAKEKGRGRAEHFSDDLRVEVLERMTLRHDLHAALARDDLFCLHQPEIDLLTGEVFSFESLVRWDHPERGLLSPDIFVPIAESTGTAGALFDRVLDHTLLAQAQMAACLGFVPSVAVNLSPRQLGDTTLPTTVSTALTSAGIPADLLWLEVTEGATAEAPALDVLRALHELGVRLAIDDFGTGWSSMARLSAFPWDILKIDRVFVGSLGADEQAEHLVRAMIVMAHALGIRTVAEGIETVEQLERLMAMGCDIGQGFLFAKPLPARTATTHVSSDGRWDGPGSANLPRAPAEPMVTLD